MAFSKNGMFVSELAAVCAVGAAKDMEGVVFMSSLILVKRTLCWWRMWAALLFLLGVHETMGAIQRDNAFNTYYHTYILVLAMMWAAQWRLLEMMVMWVCRFAALLFAWSLRFSSTKPCTQQTPPACPQPDAAQFVKSMVWYTKPAGSSRDCDIWKPAVYAECGCRHSMPLPHLLAPQQTTAIKAQKWFDKSTGHDAMSVFSRPNL
jgi:hypothetical protein